MGREPVSRVVARVVWGGDIGPHFATLDTLRDVSPGSFVIDAPCGSGVALRALPAGDRIRYLGLDLAPAMLARAELEASRRGLTGVELVEGDVAAIPAPDGGADLFLSLWGLHCLDRPEAALDEAARCLRQGGRLTGASFVTGTALRQRLLVRPHHGAFGEVVAPGVLCGWLEARFDAVELDVSGPFAYFTALGR